MRSPSLISVNPRDLRFDWHNPRLVQYDLSAVRSDDDMANFLHRHMAIDELIRSIAKSGYFAQHPLTVTEDNNAPTVLDGNRRLAAIRIITTPRLARHLNQDPFELDAPMAAQLTQLPAVVSSRQDYWRYSLNNHSHGPLSWQTYAKAQFIHDLQTTGAAGAADIGVLLGRNPSAAATLFQAREIVTQATRENIFPLKDHPGYFAFSWLHEAIKFPNIRAFTGLPPTAAYTENPVPDSHLEQLGELLAWLYGTGPEKHDAVVRRHNPDLADLDTVLRNPRGAPELRKHRDLRRALRNMIPAENIFIAAIQATRRELMTAADAISEGADIPPEQLAKAREIAIMADDLHTKPRG